MDDWYQEHNFWFTKSQRAIIRFDAAKDTGDDAAMEIAYKQFKLYSRRMEAAMPEDVRKEIELKQRAEHRAAMNDE